MSDEFDSLGRVLINRDCSAIADCRKRRVQIALDVQAIFFRRRHQPRRPPLAKIRPGSPAPAMGPGTARPGTARNASGPVPNSNLTELIIGLSAPVSAMLNVPEFCIYGSKLSNPPVWPL